MPNTGALSAKKVPLAVLMGTKQLKAQWFLRITWGSAAWKETGGSYLCPRGSLHSAHCLYSQWWFKAKVTTLKIYKSSIYIYTLTLGSWFLEGFAMLCWSFQNGLGSFQWCRPSFPHKLDQIISRTSCQPGTATKIKKPNQTVNNSKPERKEPVQNPTDSQCYFWIKFWAKVTAMLAV